MIIGCARAKHQAHSKVLGKFSSFVPAMQSMEPLVSGEEKQSVPLL